MPGVNTSALLALLAALGLTALALFFAGARLFPAGTSPSRETLFLIP